MTLSNVPISAASSVWEPNSIEEAWQLRKTLGMESKYVSGGTLLRTQWESGISMMPRHLISMAAITEMVGIQVNEANVVVGAMTSLSSIAKHPYMQTGFVHLMEAIRSIAAPSIRNMATLGGNIISAIGDSIPALLVSGAKLNWYDGMSRQTELLENWVQAISQSGRQEERLLISVNLPLAHHVMPNAASSSFGRLITFYHKVGRREAFTPSLVTTAYQGRIHEDGTFSDFRIAAGGGSSYGMRLQMSEQLLNGSHYSGDLLQKLHQTVQHQFVTCSDPFASADYRKKTAANLICSGLWKALEASI